MSLKCKNILFCRKKISIPNIIKVFLRNVIGASVLRKQISTEEKIYGAILLTLYMAMDLLSDQGLRLDGRRPNELRQIRCKLGVFSQPDGSAYLEQGNTKVLAAVYGPHEIRGSKTKSLHDKALINCQYSMAVFSTGERKRRPRGDRKSQEISMHLKQALQAAIRTELYPKSQIDVFVEVLQADGGNYCACVNASTLALMDAGIPMTDYIVACTASLANGDVPLVDISNLEENSGGPNLTVATLPLSGQMALMEMSQRFHLDHLPKVMACAMQGCNNIQQILDQAVRNHVALCGSAIGWGDKSSDQFTTVPRVAN